MLLTSIKAAVSYTTAATRGGENLAHAVHRLPAPVALQRRQRRRRRRGVARPATLQTPPTMQQQQQHQTFSALRQTDESSGTIHSIISGKPRPSTNRIRHPLRNASNGLLGSAAVTGLARHINTNKRSKYCCHLPNQVVSQVNSLLINLWRCEKRDHGEQN